MTQKWKCCRGGRRNPFTTTIIVTVIHLVFVSMTVTLGFTTSCQRYSRRFFCGVKGGFSSTSQHHHRRKQQQQQQQMIGQHFRSNNQKIRSRFPRYQGFFSTLHGVSHQNLEDEENSYCESPMMEQSWKDDNNHDNNDGEMDENNKVSPELRPSLDRLVEEITKCNDGIPINNIHSPKQVSMALFGRTQSTTQSVLEGIMINQDFTPKKRRLAFLILQYRRQGVMKQQKDPPVEKESIRNFTTESVTTTPKTTPTTTTMTVSTTPKDDLVEEVPSPQNVTSPAEPLPTSERKESKSTHEQIVDSLFFRHGSKVDDYWREPLKQVSRPMARELLKQLDSTECPMGYDPMASPSKRRSSNLDASSCSSSSTTAGKKGSFLAFCREQKELYPQCIILTRMGDFYETFGIDAVLLVEHASLNPMAGKAKAGCPYRNVQATLNALVEQGYSVAVYEEVGQTASNKLKTRVLSQIVSPASPTYLYDHNWLLGSGHQDGGASLDQLPPPRPCVGIVHTAAGYHMVECSLEERSIEYSERLTMEAVTCRLAAYPPAEPLVYIPAPTETSPSSLPFLSSSRSVLSSSSSSLSSSSSTTTQREFIESHLGGYRLRTVILPHHLVPNVDGPESDRYIQAIVDTLLKWNEKQHDDTHHELTAASRRRGGKIPEQKQMTSVKDFTISRTSSHTHPLYLETASQLGLLQDPTIPPLIASVLDDAAPAVTRRFLKRYLLVPPPPNVAQAMAAVVRCLMDDETSNVAVLPRLTVPPLGKCLSLIRAGQSSASIYGELLHTLAVTRFVLSKQNVLPVHDLLTLCSHESGLIAEHESLRVRCQGAMAAIEAIICPSHHVEDEILLSEDDLLVPPTQQLLEDSMIHYRYLPDSFVERNELSWRGRVQRAVAKEAYEAVEKAGKRLDDAIAKDFIVGDESNKALIVQDIFNNLLVLKKVPTTGSPKNNYIHPRDRHGKKLSTRFSTENVEQALSDYVLACDEACERVSAVLSNLAKTLQDDGHLIVIIQAAHLNLALSAAYHHAVQATKQNWRLAEIVESQQSESDDFESETFESSIGTFVDLWPYWMPKQRAVSNTFDLNGMFLLTAPNMSGKSTLMRSSAAAALLSVCGLCAPLGEGSRIPRFDTLFLRGASADVPAENKSAFGAEMEDIAALMRCCGPRSLVFVDEIGRGTSPRDGTRLAAAILEAMSSRGMKGIFATHLHDILHLPLRSRDRIITKQMAISRGTTKENDKDDTTYEWTYRLEDGVCHDSLATVTARRFGLPDDIIQRADELGLYLSSSHVEDISTPDVETAVEDLSIENEIQEEEEDQGSDVVVQKRLLELTNFKDVLTLAQESTNLPVIMIPRKANPPPALTNKSCVYVLELACQPPRYYVGETDAIVQRLRNHRSKGSSSSSGGGGRDVSWSNCRAGVIPVSSKSEARRLENLIIQKMVQAGYVLVSKQDGRTIRQ